MRAMPTRQILVGDEWQTMTWRQLRALVPAEISDAGLRKRLMSTQSLEKLRRTKAEAMANQVLRRWRTNNRRGQ